MGTFRGYIESNKSKVLEFLKDKDYQSSEEILRGYNGEKDIYQVRKALNELEKEGKVEFEKRFLNSKFWKIINHQLNNHESKRATKPTYLITT